MEDQILPAIRALVPQDQLNYLWFQQDGCPAHNIRAVQTLLRHTFQDRIISNGGPVNWPARSPDLTPLDFYLWGYVKNEVYEFEPPETVQELQERVQNVFNNINGNTLRRVTNTVLKRCQKCIQQNGHHIV